MLLDAGSHNLRAEKDGDAEVLGKVPTGRTIYVTETSAAADGAIWGTVTAKSGNQYNEHEVGVSYTVLTAATGSVYFERPVVPGAVSAPAVEIAEQPVVTEDAPTVVREYVHLFRIVEYLISLKFNDWSSHYPISTLQLPPLSATVVSSFLSRSTKYFGIF